MMDYFVISKGWTGLADELKSIMKNKDVEVIVDRRNKQSPVGYDRRKSKVRKIVLN
tara:strand:+ start:1165 stop:1332 length:168 start_codon:yes stop_codon:yes gene_type:complete